MAKHRHSNPAFTGNTLGEYIFMYKTRDNGKSYYRWNAPRQNRPAQHSADENVGAWSDRNNVTENLSALYRAWSPDGYCA